MAAKCAPTATIDFPDPVGVARMTFEPDTSSISASSWAGLPGGRQPRGTFKPEEATLGLSLLCSNSEGIAFLASSSLRFRSAICCSLNP